MRRLFPIALLGAVLAMAGLSAEAEEVVRSITVNGQGEVEVPPDMATVSLAVRAEAETTAEALDQASAATAGILSMLAEAGVEAADIRTGSVRLNPRYSSSVLSSGNQIVGYSAYNSVDVEVRDLARLGPLLSAAVAEGANTLNGVQFGLQNPEEHEDEARRLAVADAARRAALFAEAAGVPLGPLMTLNEAGTSGYHPIMAESRVMEESFASPEYDVPVSPGEITLSANVVLIYEIAE